MKNNSIEEALDSNLELFAKEKKYGIFYKGNLLFLSKSNLYAGAGIAKRKIIEYYGGRYASPTELKEITAEIDELITKGTLEFRKL